MSLEQLLAITLLIILALAEGLKRVRQPRSHAQNDRPPHVADLPTVRQALPALPREVCEHVVAKEHTKTVRPRPPVTPTPKTLGDRLINRRNRRDGEHRRGAVVLSGASRGSNARVGWMDSTLELRRAIVLTTILGPCRAVGPTDAGGPVSG